ncbi:sugar transferase [Cryobacterium sp. PH29-G1]|uniref:sugar transferase n=1 Tax=Cryobacterium sp. PH29-G1 TaxID=3046211 RepID=UPI0024B955BE|nr:sugar transferase [Cryobacterium sp. PH29-G1]MDJ0350795.1 sugar transferase [Cryobacterium sp. PH29-G1]
MSTATQTPTHHPRTRDWRDTFATRLRVTDLLVLIWVVFGVQIAWFGFDTADVAFPADLNKLVISYTSFSVILIASWMALLSVFATRAHRVLGTGSNEYKLIGNATIRLFGIIAIISFLFKIDIARGYILLAFPLGLVMLFFSRWLWRQWLVANRAHGRFTARVILVGTLASSARIARELRRAPGAGYRVVGAVVTTGPSADTLTDTDVPVLGGLDSVHEALETMNADTIAITSSSDMTARRMRELSWSLEPGRYHMVVVPRLTDVGGPRIHTRPVAGLPLIHVETPRYEGSKHFAKRTFDILGSGMLLLLLSPLLALLAILVKFGGPGDVLYRQERVGLNGDHFNMLKFRSMRMDADADLARLLEAQGKSDKPLFKVHNDPRITAVGRVLRKYSLDEFPQLLNVLKGDMSLVGPRPQRDGEVALYDSAAHRRLLLKPGMSGLWQVSGRSNLSWEDSIRLDLYYVENWSITGDLVILWRTFKAVFQPGAEAH